MIFFLEMLNGFQPVSQFDTLRV